MVCPKLNEGFVASQSLTCWSCHSILEFDPPLSRGESCHKCGWDVKVCKNCRFYDANAYRECREEQAERVYDKDKRNFCSWFEGNGKSSTGLSNVKTNPLDQLFGADSAPKTKSKLEDELDSFFKRS
jgi:rRNA maturation protein Nop10